MLSFYNANANSIYEMADLETKAKNRGIILSKMRIKDFDGKRNMPLKINLNITNSFNDILPYELNNHEYYIW